MREGLGEERGAPGQVQEKGARRGTGRGTSFRHVSSPRNACPVATC